MEDLNLIRFLDRYVFKNPKKLENKKVTRKGDPLAQRAGYTPQGLRSVPVDSEAYLNENEDRIPVDELFLYQFLKKKKDFISKATDDDDEDNESVNSEEFNAMLDGLAENENLDDLDIAGDIVPRKSKKKGNFQKKTFFFKFLFNINFVFNQIFQIKMTRTRKKVKTTKAMRIWKISMRMKISVIIWKMKKWRI